MTPEEIDQLAEEMATRIENSPDPRGRAVAANVRRWWRPLVGKPVLTAAPRKYKQKEKGQDQ